MANLIDRSTIESAVSGTQVITKAWLKAIIEDIEGGWWIDAPNVYPFARFDATVRGLFLGDGTSPLDLLLKSDGSGRMNVRNAADDADAEIVASQGAFLSNLSTPVLFAELLSNNTTSTGLLFDIRHRSNITASAGFGISRRFWMDNGSGSSELAAIHEVVWTNAAAGSEDADYVISLMSNGAAAAEKLRVNSGGLLSCTAIALGANPALGGYIRLPKSQWITSRNNVGDGDINLLRLNSSDRTEMDLHTKMLDVDNAAVNVSAGAVSTYWRVYLNGAEYRIPLHATS